MSKCLLCGKRNDFWSRKDPCQCESDMIDKALKLASAFDYISPAIEIAKGMGKVTRYVNGVKTDEKPDYD